MRSVIDAGLAVRLLRRKNPNASVAPGDFTLLYETWFSGWLAEFGDTILDLVEARQKTAARLRAYRRRIRR